MAEAFIYMYVVGLGLSLGIGTVAFIGWKIVKRSGNKKFKSKTRAIV